MNHQHQAITQSNNMQANFVGNVGEHFTNFGKRHLGYSGQQECKTTFVRLLREMSVASRRARRFEAGPAMLLLTSPQLEGRTGVNHVLGRSQAVGGGACPHLPVESCWYRQRVNRVGEISANMR